MAQEFRTEYVEVPAHLVASHYSKDFKPRYEQEKIQHVEPFFDQQKQTYIFRITLKKETNDE